MDTSQVFEIYGTLTKKGFPAAWECGGGMSNTGKAIGYAKSNGARKHALALRTHSNDDHALFVLNEGDLRLNVFSDGDDYHIRLQKVIGFNIDTEKQECKIRVQQFAEYSDGEWDDAGEEYIQQNPEVENFVQAMVSKATMYHCRQFFWAIPPMPRYMPFSFLTLNSGKKGE